jgi:hypothetical protein
MNKAEHDYLATSGSQKEYTKRQAELVKQNHDLIAVMMAASNRVHGTFCWDTVNPTRAAYHGVQTMIDSQIRRLVDLDDGIMTHQLTGYADDTDHYVIDEKIDAAFGKAVLTDSESGMFVCLVNKEMLEELQTYLKVNFKDLSFETVDVTDHSVFTPTVPALSNWNKAETYITKNSLNLNVLAFIKTFFS